MLSSYLIAVSTTLFFAASTLADPIPARVVAEPALVARAPVATTTPILLGCYSASKSLVYQSYAQFQTPGLCLEVCVPLSHPIMAINYQSCYCTDSLDNSLKVDDKFCDTPCPGYGLITCMPNSQLYYFSAKLTDLGGGNATSGTQYFSLWNDGYENTDLIPGASSAPSTTPSTAVPTSTKTSSPSVVTIGGNL